MKKRISSDIAVYVTTHYVYVAFIADKHPSFSHLHQTA